MHFTHRFECCFRAPDHDLRKFSKTRQASQSLAD